MSKLNKLSLVWISSALVAGCADVPFDGSLRSTQQEIVGGVTYDPSNFPAVGFLRSRKSSSEPWEQFCTATLVGQRTVITAGHCLMAANQLAAGDLEFALGPDDKTVTASSTVIGITCPMNITASPDIALAFLSSTVGVDPMPLRTKPLVTSKPMFNWLGESVRIIGYGAESNFNDYEGRGVRRSVVLEVVDPAQLTPAVTLPSTIPFLVFHSDPNNPMGSCFGDSGGPAIHENPVTGEFEVVGVSSGANSGDCVHSSEDDTVGATYWYQRTDVQQDKLLCDPSTCSNHGTCFMPEVCDCDIGFQGKDCSEMVEVDECANDPCFPGVDCTDAKLPATGYECGDCPAGYNGDGETCTDIDECATGADNCHADASCTNTEGSFTCACTDGFEGDGLDCRPTTTPPSPPEPTPGPTPEPMPLPTPAPAPTPGATPDADQSGCRCQLGAGAGAEGFLTPLLCLGLLLIRRRRS